MKIIDFFEDFQVGNESIVFKISCYDIEYLMPAVYTFKINVNLPPRMGKLVIEPLQGYSIDTIFKIQAVDFTGKNYFLEFKIK